MAILFKQFENIPLASGYKARFPLDKADYNFSARVHYSDTWTTPKPLVVYLHGSGATGYTTNTDSFISGLVNAGYGVLAIRYFGKADSSKPPFPSGYGNVNSPMLMSLFIKQAWFVEAAIEFSKNNLLNEIDPDIKLSDIIYLAGYSFGGSSAIAWSSLAGTVGFSQSSDVRGIITFGATTAGIGGFKWNNITRNLGTMSYMIQAIQHDIVYCYNDLDDYAPPDYSRRLQYSVPTGKRGYFISLGKKGHVFEYQLCVDVFNQLNIGLPPKYKGKLIEAA